MSFRLAFSLLSLALTATLAAREPWTTSRIQGSPEPPRPYTTEQVFSSIQLQNVLEIIAVPGESRLLMVEDKGPIWQVSDQPDASEKHLVIDLSKSHSDLTHVYGISLHPDYPRNREIFISYTLASGLDDGTKLSRFQLSSVDPLTVDPASEELFLTWRSGGHNGANLRFGPDGMLYISTGDSEVPAPPDPLNTGQDNSDLLSAILRIDVDHPSPGLLYSVPKDNPFVGKENVRGEIWAFGLRNPWKMAFAPDGRLWCGDVGWELWEMIHLIKRGSNHGWSAIEATQSIKPSLASPLAPITPPVIAHSHAEAASITGGFVYRGSRFPELLGAYIYGDYETGKIWALWHDGEKITRHEEIADTPHKIVTFGETQAGELYYANWANPSTLHQLIPNPRVGQPSHFPRKLSESGLFTDTAKQVPAKGVLPFSIREPMWMEGTTAQRFIALPGEDTKIDTRLQRNKDGSVRGAKPLWPIDSVLARTVSTPGETARPVETQVLHFDGDSWNGYIYRWNGAATDAELIDAAGAQSTIDLPRDGKSEPFQWQHHSRGECARCHTNWAGFALAFQPQQLLTIADQPAEKAAVELGLTDPDYFAQSAARLVGSTTTTASTAERARSWLHGNCAHCHRQNGGGSVAVVLNAELPDDRTASIGEKALRGDFGLDDAQIIRPGAPWSSALYSRIARIGSGHMPLIGAREPDPTALRVVWDWIQEMPGGEGKKALPAAPDTPSHALVLMHEIDAGHITGAEKEAVIQTALKSNDANIHSLFERYLPQSQRAQTLGANIDRPALLSLSGDAARGKDLLLPTGKLAVCLACHFVNGTGRDFGPDLSHIGSRATREMILESLVEPSKVIAPGFQAEFIETNHGPQTGFIVKEDGRQIRLKIATGQTLPIAVAEIKSRKPLPVSFMPEGQLQALTAQEAADLLAFLTSLK